MSVIGVINKMPVYNSRINNDACFVIHTSRGDKFAYPVCQRCGKCCHNLMIISLWRSIEDHTCKYLIEPNICTVQDNKNPICKDYPVCGEAGVYDSCLAYRMVTKEIHRFWSGWSQPLACIADEVKQ